MLSESFSTCEWRTLLARIERNTSNTLTRVKRNIQLSIMHSAIAKTMQRHRHLVNESGAAKQQDQYPLLVWHHVGPRQQNEEAKG